MEGREEMGGQQRINKNNWPGIKFSSFTFFPAASKLINTQTEAMWISGSHQNPFQKIIQLA